MLPRTSIRINGPKYVQPVTRGTGEIARNENHPSRHQATGILYEPLTTDYLSNSVK